MNPMNPALAVSENPDLAPATAMPPAVFVSVSVPKLPAREPAVLMVRVSMEHVFSECVST